MSTLAIESLSASRIETDRLLYDLVCRLEGGVELFQPHNIHARLLALDELDAAFGSFDEQEPDGPDEPSIRAKLMHDRLQVANAEQYQLLRTEIVDGGHAQGLLQWLNESGDGSTYESPSGMGFDTRDELLSGILKIPEPEMPSRYRSPEMVPYQPTPVRHILHLIEALELSEDDCFMDLGSGLGHVPLLISILTGVQCVGIELQHAYVASAQQCAQSLNLNRVSFLAQDARAADLSRGTVFYLYSPFKGHILEDVLGMLKAEGAHRRIKVCSLGPCTPIISHQTWLQVSTEPTRERVTLFESL